MGALLVKVLEGDDLVPLDSIAWDEWDGEPPRVDDSFPALAVSRWASKPGNLRPGERKTVTVYHVPGRTKATRHANGAPMTAIATVFQVGKEGGNF